MSNESLLSLWLNYERAFFVYQSEFATVLRTLQQSCIAQSIQSN